MLQACIYSQIPDGYALVPGAPAAAPYPTAARVTAIRRSRAKGVHGSGGAAELEV